MFFLKHTALCRAPFAAVGVVGVITVLLACSPLRASDHADPMDLTRLKPIEPVITDLFVFPVDDSGNPAFPFERTDHVALHNPNVELPPKLSDEQRTQIKALVVILCVRRALTQTGSLNLEPYTYRVHMDTRSNISYNDTPADQDAGMAGSMGNSSRSDRRRKVTDRELRVRYGGKIEHPESIADDVLIEITLQNDAALNKFKVVRGLDQADSEGIALGRLDPSRISVWSGVRDDPFIFPAFFRTNVVAMVMHIPMTCFRDNQRDWLVWGTSHKGRRQIDHVGRSLRTQNPRFELLNTVPPNMHVDAIKAEHENPSLVRDLFLRAGLESYFAYREWDFVPDVMIYTDRYQVGFPNGRLPTDDVAAILAQQGDTLLLELSHHNAQWPRQTKNDKEFLGEFPYLAEPWPDREPPPQHHLSRRNILILIAIALLLLLLLVLENWIVARWYCRKKQKQQLL